MKLSTQKAIGKLLFILVPLFLLSCSSTGEKKASETIQRNSWKTPHDTILKLNENKEFEVEKTDVLKKSYWVVAEERRLSAIKELSDSIILKLTDKKAKEYTNNKYRSETTKTPFLIRAARSGLDRGEFYVEWGGTTKILNIINTTLGNYSDIRVPLIVNLESKPKFVYSQIHSAM